MWRSNSARTINSSCICSAIQSNQDWAQNSFKDFSWCGETFFESRIVICGHRKDKLSQNKDNFLKIPSCYVKQCDKIIKLVLKKTSKNNQLNSNKVQKDIIVACKIEIIKAITEDLVIISHC